MTSQLNAPTFHRQLRYAALKASVNLKAIAKASAKKTMALDCCNILHSLVLAYLKREPLLILLILFSILCDQGLWRRLVGS